MKIHSIRTLMFAACFLALVAAAPGTAIGQIHIQTIEQLQKIGDNASFPDNESYVLDNDIDASVTRMWNDNGSSVYLGFSPICDNVSHPFTGTFDGQGHVIRNLYIFRPDNDTVGLFGNVDNATITNLGLDNASVAGNDVVGGLIGHIASTDASTITSCYTAGTVSGNGYVGGLVGYNDYGLIESCYSTATVTGAYEVGGLVGYNYDDIESSYSTGAVYCSGYDAGGLVGWNDGGIYISYSTGSVSGYDGVGGLVGYNNGVILGSYSASALNGHDYVGGLVGYNDNYIYVCYSTGAVIGNDDVGGLVGYNNAFIGNCYSHGSVTGDSAVGGLVGYNNDYIEYTYSAGAVTGNADVGGLVGYNDSNGYIYYSFYDIFTSLQEFIGVGNNNGIADVTGQSTAEMRTKKNFTDAGWDFSTIWSICNNKTYPLFVVLRGAPVAVADDYSMQQNTTLYVTSPNILSNDSDPNCGGMSALLVSTTSHGNLALSPDGSFIYTPAADFTGIDRFTYKATNSLTDNSTPAEVLIAVANTAPTAASDNYSTARNTPLAIAAPGVLANDTDNESDNLTATLMNPTDHGTIRLNSDGSFLYAPAADFRGTDTFIYRASDGVANSFAATVRITVGSNAAPVVTPDNYTTERDTPLTVAAPGVIGNDTDADNDTLTAILVRNPAHGTIILNADGSFTYTPAAGYRGPDNFVYRASDGMVNSGTATVTITVGSNVAPVVTPDSYATGIDTALTVPAAGVLTNDTDADGDTLTAVLVSNTAHGTIVLSDNGSFTYTPDTGYHGSDSFTYKANDGMADSAMATVMITVGGGNAAPVVTPDSYTTDMDTALTEAAPGVLTNDTDADGDTLTAVLVSNPVHGGIVLNADGSFTYTPDTGYRGPDSFTYKANDGLADSAVATVTITVGSNMAPIVTADSYSTARNTPLTIAAPGVLGNDSDPDGDNMTAVLTGITAHGFIMLSDNGSFTYTPDAGYVGIDQFTYKANDGMADSPEVVVTITVGTNAVPVVTPDSYATARDTPITVSAPGVLGNDSDADGDSLTAVQVSSPIHGIVALNGNGSFTYTPDYGYHGLDSFTYKANDGIADSAVATVTITVGSNTVPDVIADSYFVDKNGTLSETAPGVLGNDSDPDGDSLTAVLVSTTHHGNLVLNADGSFTYTPDADYRGLDSFTYAASDGFGESGAATVTITVGTNFEPLVVADNYTAFENTQLVVAAPGVLTNDSDADGDSLTAVIVSTTEHGALVLSDNGSFIYTPDLDYVGIDTFTYKANDGMADSAVATVTITVGHNEPPVVAYDNYTTPRNTPLTIEAPGVLANDTDPDNDTLTAVLAGTTAHGTLVLSDNGSFIYTPDDGFVGIDTFTYVANDGIIDSAVATVRINVGSNKAPQVASNLYAVEKNTVLTVDNASGVLANDVDADNDTLTAVLVSTTLHGTLVLSDNGSFIYTPDADFMGLDSFTYTANDGYVDSAIATVTINVVDSTLPIGVADEYRSPRNTALIIRAPGLLGNDNDPAGRSLEAALVAAPVHGEISLSADGSFIYIPDPDCGCVDTFTYKAGNGSTESGAVTVTITVNSAPVAMTDNYTLRPKNAFPVIAPGVLANDLDPDSDNLTALLVTPPEFGEFALSSDGSFLYLPARGFIGDDSFSYRIYDGFEYSAPVTVILMVKIPCPLASMYGEYSPEVAALRKFRDQVLDKTVMGKAMIKLYYRMAPAVEPMIENNAWFRQTARTVVDRILPLLNRR